MKKRPNILLLVSDHHRGDWLPYPNQVLESLGLESIPAKMPTLKGIMKEGTCFVNCITPSPLCAPARACLASGRDYAHCGVRNNSDNYPVNQRTFYSVLKEIGYLVAGVGKFDLHKPDHWWGLNGWVDELEKMGFTHGIDNEGKIDGIVSGKDEPKGPYMKFLHENGLVQTYLDDMLPRLEDRMDTRYTLLPDEAYCDNWIGDNGVKMIKTFEKGKPWFLQVNFAGPHDPWDITKSMKERWENVEFEKAKGNTVHDPDKVNAVKQNFAAMLENIDANIDKILQVIKEKGELEDTLIIYTSDHGEMLGDKGLYGKSLPYFGSVSIPLIIKKYGITQNQILYDRVELHDIANTIVEYAGGTMPEAKESESLRGLLEGTRKYGKRIQKSGLKGKDSNWYMTVENHMKKIFENDVLTEKYNLLDDPFEIHNLEQKRR